MTNIHTMTSCSVNVGLWHVSLAKSPFASYTALFWFPKKKKEEEEEQALHPSLLFPAVVRTPL